MSIEKPSKQFRLSQNQTMSNQKPKEAGKNVVVLGSSGLIGKKVCEQALNKGYNLIEIGRKKRFDQSSHFNADFQNINKTIEAFKKLKLKNSDSLVFAHRSRHRNSDLNEDSFYLGMKEEINPYLGLFQVLSSSNFDGLSLNVVNVSSVAATKGAYDVGFTYHLIKAAQSEAGKMLAYIPGLKLYTNTVSFGEAINDELSEHSRVRSKLFEHAKTNLGGKDLPSISQIVKMIMLLCSADQYGLSGQTLSVDSGISHLSIEYVLRQGTDS